MTRHIKDRLGEDEDSWSSFLLDRKSILAFACIALIAISLSFMRARKPDPIPPDGYDEHLIYRIDEHRYFTIRGSHPCVGRIYYYDTRFGMDVKTRINAGETRIMYQGYYTADSKHVVAPLVSHPSNSITTVIIYYSTDEGRTFKYFIAGGYDKAEGFVVLQGDYLYSGIYHPDNKRFSVSYRFDILNKPPLDGARSPDLENREKVDPSDIPFPTDFNSNKKWECSLTEVNTNLKLREKEELELRSSRS
jgi:hypothetical protein